jgi:hypothetical protein
VTRRSILVRCVPISGPSQPPREGPVETLAKASRGTVLRPGQETAKQSKPAPVPYPVSVTVNSRLYRGTYVVVGA